MKISKVLGHPVRAAIIACLGDRRMTRRQLERLMPDVPAPTVYRNLRVLIDEGVVEEADRLASRGPGEVRYRAVPGRSLVSSQDVAEWTDTERLEVYESFVRSLAASYRAYVAAGGRDPAMGRARLLHLADDERDEFRRRLLELVAEYEGLPPFPGRRRYVMAEVFQPDERPDDGAEE